MDIVSYGDKETEEFDLTGRMKKNCKWRSVADIARRKLDILIFGASVSDFKIPPGNRFEYLKGDLVSFASIRINDQWRIIFRVTKSKQLESVQIVDYHK